MAGFEDEMAEAEKENSNRTGGFYAFKKGSKDKLADNKLHILTEPKIEISRFGFGICYAGAPYCTKEALEASYKENVEKAKEAGEDPKKVSRPNLTKRFLCWAIDRMSPDGNIVILKLPYGVAKSLLELKASDEGAFSTWPMPYGINIKTNDKVGTKDVKYELIASRTNTPITEEEMAELEKLTPIDQILDRIKDKQRQKIEGGNLTSEAYTPIEYPSEDINPDDIPF